MYIEIMTPVEDVVNELKVRLDKQLQNNYYGILMSSIVPVRAVLTGTLARIHERFMDDEEEYIEKIVTSNINVNVILKSGRLYELTIKNVHILVAFNRLTRTTMRDRVKLYEELDIAFYKFQMKFNTKIEGVTDFSLIKTNDFMTIKFITLSVTEFMDVYQSIISKNFVKKPSITTAEKMIQYYVERDKDLISIYENYLYQIEQKMRANNFYLHKSYPVYKKRLLNGDDLYISTTFCVLYENSKNVEKTIIVIYDYLRQDKLEIVLADLEDIGVTEEEVNLITDLYKYNRR